MKTQPETLFKERIAPQLKAVPRSWWVKTQQRAIRGTPDILGVVNGRMVALELKASARARGSALQKYNIEKINKAGGYAAFVSPENWYRVLTDLVMLATP